MKKGWTVHHNGPPAKCILNGVVQSHERCKSFWKGVTDFHTNPPPDGQGWSANAYSFGICPHGERFVSNGWDKNQFANGSDDVGEENGPNSEWYSVLMFVGGGGTTGYPEEKPTPEMDRGLIDLINEGRDTGRCGMAVKPHSDWKVKDCPGPDYTAKCRAWDGKVIETQEEDPLAAFTEQDLENNAKEGSRTSLNEELTTKGKPVRTALLDLSRRADLVTGGHFLAVEEDFTTGGMVYFISYASGGISFPQGSPLHEQIKADLVNQGVSKDARRLPKEVFEQLVPFIQHAPVPSTPET